MKMYKCFRGFFLKLWRCQNTCDKLNARWALLQNLKAIPFSVFRYI